MESHVEKLREMLGKCNVCMFGTFDDESRVTFRPMAHVDVDNLGNIWFFAGVDTPKAAHVNANPNVYLNFSCEKESTYLAIEGVANVSNINRDRMRELFSPFVKSWFPQGLDDPNLGLMVVHPLEIDYWIKDESKILTYTKMLTKTATGVKSMVAEHGKILM